MTIKNIEGRTYSLPETGEYYIYIREQVNRLSAILGGLDFLDKVLSELIAKEPQPVKKYEKFEEIFAPISFHLLDHYTPNLLATFLYPSLSKNNKEAIFNISVRGYHLRMLHIEVLNQVMGNAFSQSLH